MNRFIQINVIVKCLTMIKAKFAWKANYLLTINAPFGCIFYLEGNNINGTTYQTSGD